MKLRLNLGSGLQKLDNYVNIDIDISTNPDLVATHFALPFASNSVDVIEIYHSIEHLYLWDTEIAVQEWLRVLKPGGQLIVECPDIRKSIQYMLRQDDFSRFSNRGLLGIYGDIENKNYYYGHHWGYTVESLSGLLLRAGFGRIISETPRTHMPERDLRLVGTKPFKEIVPFESNSMSRPPRVFWALLGPVEIASARIHGYRIHEYLRQQGWTSEIIVQPVDALSDIPLTSKDFRDVKSLNAGDVLIIQKFAGPRTAELLEQLTGMGVKTIYLDCDMPLKLKEAAMALWTVCSSAYLAEQYRLNGVRNAIYIPDAVEIFKHPDVSNDGELKCAWFGYWTPQRETGIAFIRGILSTGKFNNIKLINISNSPNADIKWEQNSSLEHLHKCDFVVLPTRLDEQAKSKSSNRALQAMALGLPVLASPIPAYQEIVQNGFNGFICNSDDEWLEALQQISKYHVRKLLSENAYKYAQQYSIVRIGEMWKTFFVNSVANEFNDSSSPNTVSSHSIRRIRARANLMLSKKTSTTAQKVIYLRRSITEWPFDPDLAKEILRVIQRQAKRLKTRLLR